MGTLTTKYDVGQTVWCASTHTGARRLPCPDCHGTERWQSNSSSVIDAEGGIYTGTLFGEASTLMAEAAAEIDRLTARLSKVSQQQGTPQADRT